VLAARRDPKLEVGLRTLETDCGVSGINCFSEK
jgi:hypothetical protein